MSHIYRWVKSGLERVNKTQGLNPSKSEYVWEVPLGSQISKKIILIFVSEPKNSYQKYAVGFVLR
jgi:hypothetical protein